MKKRLKSGLAIILGSCFVLTAGLFSACDTDTHEHIYESWQELVAPGCETEGSKTATCTVCQKPTTVPIPATGHTWGRTVELIRSANCTQTGERVAVCEVCSNQGTEITPALGHNWKVETVLQEATCTEAGLQSANCTRCSTSGEVEVPALGHDWETTYTIERAATFDEAGSKSQHCTRCNEVTNVTEIPKLEANKPTQYTFRLARTNGDLIQIAGVKGNVYDEGGSLMGTVTFSKGKAQAALLPQNYTVELEGVPNGYTAEASYSVGWENPVCTVTLTGSLLQGTPAASVSYVEGSAMHDFTYTTLATDKRESETITLSALLEDYKIVVLNFWYVDCQFCRYEFPGMQAAYEEYKDEVAIIAIDATDTNADYIRTFVNSYKLGFYIAQDGAGLTSRFGVSAFPTTVVIDREGIVSKIHASALVNPLDYEDLNYCTRQFKNLFEKYTTAPYYQGATED